MPLTLEQYIERLDSRTDLPWPTAPRIDPPKARPHLTPLPVKAVLWTVYGTLVAIPQGELLFEPAQDFVLDIALDKVIKEFKMWNSMSRKPGAPSAYMKELFSKALSNLRMTSGGGGEKLPEIRTELVWEDIVGKLLQKEYVIDTVNYGSLNQFVMKVAYFYHASIQGAGPYREAAATIRGLTEARKLQGLLADGQCFTAAQLERCLKQEDQSFMLDTYIPASARFLSADLKARKPSETLFRAALKWMDDKGLRPADILHVGSSIARDIAPAKKHGFRTALFAADKHSLAATPDQLKDPASRPDVMLTELPQLLEVVA